MGRGRPEHGAGRGHRPPCAVFQGVSGEALLQAAQDHVVPGHLRSSGNDSADSEKDGAGSLLPHALRPRHRLPRGQRRAGRLVVHRRQPTHAGLLVEGIGRQPGAGVQHSVQPHHRHPRTAAGLAAHEQLRSGQRHADLRRGRSRWRAYGARSPLGECHPRISHGSDHPIQHHGRVLFRDRGGRLRSARAHRRDELRVRRLLHDACRRKAAESPVRRGPDGRRKAIRHRRPVRRGLSLRRAARICCSIPRA